jgi:hypothetical protein
MKLTGMHPADGPRDTKSEAERRVYEALSRGLPSEMGAWHSVPISSDDGDREIDFVVAHPARGFLAIEVKGGRVEQRGGRWTQNGEPIKDPGTQAVGGAHALAREIKSRFDTKVHNESYAHAVWFPDVAVERDPSQGNLHGRVLGWDDLSWTREAILSVFDRHLPGSSHAPRRLMEAIHSIWGERWVPEVSLGARVERDARRRVELERAQYEIIESFEDNPRLLVRGAAGTGKTLVAVEAARRRAARGERVLLTCFTQGLARWLGRHCREHETIEIATVRELAVELLREAGAAIDPAKPDFWENVGLEAACDALGRSTRRWDAVIVDEAQDLTESDWALVEECAADRPLWVFTDESQRFWPDREIPARLAFAVARLTRRYRTPSTLAALAEAFSEGRPIAEPLAPVRAEGALTVVEAPTESAVRKFLERELDKLRGAGLAPADIAILSLRGSSAEGSIVGLDRLGAHRLVRADADEAREHVVADSFLRFKGLERPAILVTDLRLVQDQLGVRMYIALTRALHRVTLVAPTDVLARHGLSAAV